MQRFLIPLKNPDDASQAVAYAIRRRAEGLQIAVSLLHVEESEKQWRARKFGQDFRVRGKLGADDVFLEATRMLDGLDVEISTHVRSGPVIFSILDLAEELDCNEIVVPVPDRYFFGLLSRNIVTTLMARQRSIRVVAVNKRGIPVVSTS